MGRSAVYDFAHNEDVTEVVVADYELARAKEVAERYGNGKTRAVQLDVSDGAALRDLLKECVAALGAVSYKYNEAISQAAIETKTHYVDLGGNNTVVEAQFALSDKAKEADIALVPDCGIAPGAVGIFAASCIERQPEAHSVRIRVGGLPKNPEPPLNYQVVFSAEGLINEYKEPTICLKDGKVKEVPTLGELEYLTFPEPFGELEAFNTSGGVSTLPHTLKDKVQNIDYKTMRYKGHCHIVRALFALGLADEEPETAAGKEYIPRKVLEHQIVKTLGGNEPDVILALIEAEGPEGKFAYRIIDHLDEQTGLSAMARCTSFPAAIIAHMLASGAVSDRGTLHQELSIPPTKFIEEFRKRGIKVEEL